MATLSVSDLDAFSRDGFFVAPDMFSASECDGIVGLVEAAPFEVALGDPSDGRGVRHLLAGLGSRPSPSPHRRARSCRGTRTTATRR
jgi:hypothetical protein